MIPSPDREQAAPARLLVIEGGPGDPMLLEATARDSYLSGASIEHAKSVEAGMARLETDWFDGVLIHLDLPDSASLGSFSRLWGVGGRAALVVPAEHDDAHLAAEVFRLGAQDYLVKSAMRPGDLGRAVDRAIRRQRVLQETERARDAELVAKEQFLSHVSHELRSPLSVVHQFASLLLDGVGGDLSVDQRDFLTVLMRNVGQLRVMIDDLLQVTRADSGRLTVAPQALAIHDLLIEAVAAYRPNAERRHIRLSVATNELPTVVADAERLLEVLTNLLDNALKFTPDGGHIAVEADVQGDKVCVIVRDSGRGIRPEDEDRIFEQFFQAKQYGEESRNGLGLGLYICRDLIERQGGVIWATSNLGHGTEVAFTVPILNKHNDAMIRS